jgi:hypothetical protein
MEKVYKVLEKISVRNRFVIMTIMCFAADFINVVYANSYFITVHINTEFVNRMMFMYGINPGGLSSTEINEFRQMIMQTIGTGFFLALGIHFVIYTFAAFRKKFAIHYVYYYTLTAIVLTLFEIVSLMQKSIGWGLMMLLTTVMYGIGFLVLKHHRQTGEQ